MPVNTGNPKPPPYPVGTRLRYCGHVSFTIDNKQFGPGDKGIVVRVNLGKKGSGKLIEIDEDGVEYFEGTQDGWSVVKTDNGIERVVDKYWIEI